MKKKVVKKADEHASLKTPKVKKVVFVDLDGEGHEMKQAKTKRPKSSELTKEHWKEMPEFVQEDLKPAKKLIVHFRNSDDMHKFSKLVGQQITAKTAYIWYPEAPKDELLNRRWAKKK